MSSSYGEQSLDRRIADNVSISRVYEMAEKIEVMDRKLDDQEEMIYRLERKDSSNSQ